MSNLNLSSINGLNLYSYANNNPIGIAYRINVGVNKVATNSNSHFNVIAQVFYQTSTNNSSFSLKTLSFSMGYWLHLIILNFLNGWTSQRFI